MESVRLRYEQSCRDCGGSDFVEDHAQGDLVCTVRLTTPMRSYLLERMRVEEFLSTSADLRACGRVARDRREI
jgi:hypothetical protein